MNPHTLDIGQTLLNNTLHAPWIGKLELKRSWLLIDDFLFFVRMRQRIYLLVSSFKSLTDFLVSQQADILWYFKHKHVKVVVK